MTIQKLGGDSMYEEDSSIACMEVYGAEGMFGEQYSQRTLPPITPTPYHCSPCEDDGHISPWKYASTPFNK